MRYSTGLKKRSRLQGHRKRRRTPEALKPARAADAEGGEPGLSWTEYKAMRQYQSFGNMLDRFKVYGFGAGVEAMIDDAGIDTDNGHDWLIEDYRGD
ncbi:MAG: hypothetical protein HY893_03695 [Deltaproteobacteria bacterium]|nr:hypothetical protein [Deltaproteobacteria bacterium]